MRRGNKGGGHNRGSEPGFSLAPFGAIVLLPAADLPDARKGTQERDSIPISAPTPIAIRVQPWRRRNWYTFAWDAMDHAA